MSRFINVNFNRQHIFDLHFFLEYLIVIFKLALTLCSILLQYLDTGEPLPEGQERSCVD